MLSTCSWSLSPISPEDRASDSCDTLYIRSEPPPPGACIILSRVRVCNKRQQLEGLLTQL